MNKERLRRIARRVILGAIFISVVLFVLDCSGFRSLSAPVYYCVRREKMGAYVGNIQMSEGDKKYACCVYRSFQSSIISDARKSPPPQRCLVVRKLFGLALFPYSGSFKITKTTIGIFNDHFTQCLPFFGYLFESSMTLPVYSVDDDMKGWNRKFKITPKGDSLEYRIISPKEGQSDIVFSVPLRFFD